MASAAGTRAQPSAEGGLDRQTARALVAIHERQNLQECRNIVTMRGGADGLAIQEFASGSTGGLIAARCASVPTAEANNMLSGYGPAHAHRLGEVVAWVDEAQCGLHTRLNAGEATLQTTAPLIEAGFGLAETEVWLWCDPATCAQPRVDRGVEIVLGETPQARSLWADVAVAGWGLESQAATLFRAALTPEPAPSNWRYLIATLDGVPAGEALLTFEVGPDGALLAYCGDAAVAPAFRGRGLQRALLHARAALANEAGCRVMFAGATYGAASAANMMRVGMQVADITLLWFRPARGQEN